MSSILTIDIGAGTMDVLMFNTETGEHFKAVVVSPLRTVAQKVKQAKGDVLITGVEMGGGEVSQQIKACAREKSVTMTRSAAATIHHNSERIKEAGITIIEKGQAEHYCTENTSTIKTADIEIPRLKKIVEACGLPFQFDIVGICAQDHGAAPAGVSHLDFRHRQFKTVLDEAPYPHALLYPAQDIPVCYTRLTAIAQTARRLPAREVYVMDSGMAAMLGAALDERAKEKECIVVLDVATSHTLCAALKNGVVCGFFEFHTKDITALKLDEFIVQLTEGAVSHKDVLKQGGHGAYLRNYFGFKKTEAIIATGPKRSLLRQSRHNILFGAPLGDNMMTGTVGLLEAIRIKTGQKEIIY